MINNLSSWADFEDTTTILVSFILQIIFEPLTIECPIVASFKLGDLKEVLEIKKLAAFHN